MQLENLVLEKKEIAENDLVSLLQVSPNYIFQLKKEVLRGGKVVEDWVNTENDVSTQVAEFRFSKEATGNIGERNLPIMRQ